jgi:predicted lipoprotein with Yx(FWY)xxD motif
VTPSTEGERSSHLLFRSLGAADRPRLMRRARIGFAVAALGIAAMLAGGGGAGAMTITEASAAKAKKTTELELRKSKFGKVLFAGNGRALYMFTSDTAGASNCSGACAAAWPPFHARGKLVAGEGVNRKLLGTTTRANGRKQVTYNGRPLYFYVNDPKGEIFCHHVFEFGGEWLVVRASGKPAP